MKIIPLFASTVLSLVGVATVASGQQLAFDHASIMVSLDAPERARFRFLHVSTDEVYGTLGENGSFSETTPYAPNSPSSANFRIPTWSWCG